MTNGEMTKAMERVRSLAKFMGMEPPHILINDESAPSAKLREFRNQTGLSYDWIFCGALPRSIPRAI